MVQGMLAVAVFCMFVFCFYIANKIDQFFDAIQETVKDKPERKQTGLKILFLDTLSDNDLLKEVQECKRQYIEAKIIIFDGQAEVAE